MIHSLLYFQYIDIFVSRNISEIQKQASDQGQIKYYSDKQHLFAKWAKLEISRHHYHVTNIEPKTKAKQQQHLQEEEEIRHQEYNALSPRSIYYQECVNQQIIPEPIYSRIKECHEPVSSQFSLPQLKDATASSSSCFLPHSSSDREQDSIFPNAKEFSTKRHESSSMAHDHQVLSKKQNLELNLQHFGLGDTKIHAFCRSFEHFKDLSVLNLSENRLTENSIIELLQALQEGRKELSLLNLSKNRIASKAACQQVASFLESCISLTTLDLSDTTLRDDIGAITLAIESHPSLKIVNLSYNHIGEDGGMLIGNMITQKSCCVT
jgi:hypothetical protein